jgi:hypothetical protein
VEPTTTTILPTTTTPSGGGGCISYGAVIVIILLVLAIIYCTGTAAYYRSRLQVSRTELMNHQKFGISSPTYAKDDVIYA